MFQHISKLKFYLLVLFVGCAAFVSPIYASASNGVLFIAHQQNGDGQLYAVSYEGETTLLSPADRNVTQFLIGEDGHSVIYLTTDADTSLTILNLETSTSTVVQLDGLDNTHLLQFDRYIWLVGRSEGNPPTLYGIDASTGYVIAERTFRFADVRITLHPSGQWGLAYRVLDDSLPLDVFSLPSLESQPLSVSGNATGIPRWSPTLPLLLIPGTNDQNGGVGFFLANVESGGITFVQIPDADPLSLWAEWSDGGRYVLYRGNYVDGTPLAGMIDTQAGSVADLSHLNWQRSLGWSDNDQAVLLAAVADATQPAIQFVAVDVLSGDVTDLSVAVESINPLAIGWADDGNTVAFIGHEAFASDYLIYTFQLQDGTLRTALATQDPAFAQAQLLGVEGEQALVLTIETLADGSETTTESSLLAVDLQSGGISRLSPAGFFVDPFSVRVRP